MDITRPDSWAFRRLLKKAVAFPLIALGFLIAFLFWQIAQLIEAARWVDHTDQVISSGWEVQKLILDSETGLRGYLLTKRDDFLAPYLQAESALNREFPHLLNLVSGNSEQVQRAKAIQQTYYEWRAITEGLIARRSQDGNFLDVVQAGMPKRLMDSIRALTASFIQVEEDLRASRVRANERAANRTYTLGLILTIALGVMLAYFSRRTLLTLSRAFEATLQAERKQSEELSVSRERLRTIMNSLPVGVVIADANGDIVEVNEAAKTIWADEKRFKLDQYDQYKAWRIESNVRIRSEEWALARAVKEGKSTLNEELDIEAFDHTRKTILNSAAPVMVDNQIVAAVAVMQDITERRQAEETIRDLQRQNELILQSVGEGITGLDLQGRTTFINFAARKMMGWDSADLIGKVQHDVIHHTRPDGTPYPRDECPIYRALQDKKSYTVDHEVFWRKDGTSFPVEYTSTPIVEDGNAIGAVVVFRDITERRRAERALKEANELLEKRVEERTRELKLAYDELESFSYSVSHDLRAPLRSMEGFSKILMERHADKLDAKALDYLRRIRAATVRMAKLIDDMLGLAGVSRAELHRQNVDLSSMVQKIADDLRNAHPGRSVEFDIQPGQFVEGDKALLHVVLDNLIGNAWKYTSKQPAARIEFGSTVKNGKKVFFVRDNGAGFDMAYASKLFTAFHRLHSESDFEGTGVGLATVHRIIRRHSGEVWAEGAVGQGATFYFRI